MKFEIKIFEQFSLKIRNFVKRSNGEVMMLNGVPSRSFLVVTSCWPHDRALSRFLALNRESGESTPKASSARAQAVELGIKII